MTSQKPNNYTDYFGVLAFLGSSTKKRSACDTLGFLRQRAKKFAMPRISRLSTPRSPMCIDNDDDIDSGPLYGVTQN